MERMEEKINGIDFTFDKDDEIRLLKLEINLLKEKLALYQKQEEKDKKPYCTCADPWYNTYGEKCRICFKEIR